MDAVETLVIERLGFRGEGVTRVKNEPVFVPLTLPGETIRAQILGNRGTLCDIVVPSPERRQAPCKHFGACGGCQLQHLASNFYRAFKRDLVVSALSRVGIDTEVADPIIAHGAGRRRVTLHAQKDAAGFMALRSHAIHDLDYCPILVPALKSAPDIARAVAEALGPCDVALTASDTGLDVGITAKNALPSERLTALARRFDLARLSLNGEPVSMSRQPLVAMGKAMVPLPVESFLQATQQAEAILADLVCATAGKAKSVADLFCGVGPFALRLAEMAKVQAFDSNGPAIAALESAKRTASGLKPIMAKKRDLFRDPLSAFELNGFDMVVLDPPRAGAQAQVKELARAKVKTIAYVSCDPKSFARDAAILIAGGYRLAEIVPVDQFAFSAHVEVFARFSR